MMAGFLLAAEPWPPAIKKKAARGHHGGSHDRNRSSYATPSRSIWQDGVPTILISLVAAWRIIRPLHPLPARLQRALARAWIRHAAMAAAALGRPESES
jgi:hypothetical protein